MSNSGFQSLLMESGSSLPPLTSCVGDGPTFEEATVSLSDITMVTGGMVVGDNSVVFYRSNNAATSYIYRTVDKGQNWDRLSPGFSIQDIAGAFYVGGVFVLVRGSAATSRVVYRSIDNGITWSQNTTAMPASVYSYGLSTDGDNIIAGLRWNQTTSIRSVDRGATWAVSGSVPSRQWNGGAYLNGNYFCLARNNNEVYWSTNDGVSWGVRSTLPSFPIAGTGYTSLVELNGYLVAYSFSIITADRVYYALSDDDGASWTQYEWPYAGTNFSARYWDTQGCYIGAYRNLTNIHIVLSTDLINWYEAVDSPQVGFSGSFPFVVTQGYVVGGNMGTPASNNRAVYGYCPGAIIPTSGTEYPSGEAATVHTGQITLANHYQPLSGQSAVVNQGYTRIGAAPITPTLVYTTSSNPSISPITPLSVQLRGILIFSTIGGVTFFASYSYSNGEGSSTGATLSNWLDPNNASNGQYYEIQIDPSYRINYPPPSTPPGIGIDYSTTGITHFTVNGDGGNNIWNSMEVARMLPLYRNFEKSSSSQLDFVDLAFSVRPRTGSGLIGPVYEKTYTIRINFAASKFK